MNHIDLIKRAFHITWRYKVLWIFGILLALTSGGGGGSGGGGNFTTGGGNHGAGGMPPLPSFGRFDPNLWIGIALLCCCLLLIWAVAATILRYVARTALYRGVNQIEADNAAPKWRAGFRLGWSNRAFRLWLLDLIIGVPFALIALLLLALGASPLLLLLGNETLQVFGVILTIGFELWIILLLIIAGIIVSVLGQFWAREITLADRGIGQAIATGYQLARGRLRDVGVMWLLLAAIGLGLGVIVVPLVILIIGLAAAGGFGVGYGMYTLTHSLGWAIAIGLPPFLLITVVPLTLIQGVYMVFESSAWTLTYREVAKVEA